MNRNTLTHPTVPKFRIVYDAAKGKYIAQLIGDWPPLIQIGEEYVRLMHSYAHTYGEIDRFLIFNLANSVAKYKRIHGPDATGTSAWELHYVSTP